MAAFAALVLLTSTLWAGVGLLALVRATRAGGSDRRDHGAALPPITVLKPLCGADDALAGNLETFFRQDHPRYEILFGVESEADPAVPIVRRSIAAHPEIPARLVIHGGARGTNPKVSNLSGILPEAQHDWVLISDSNVAVPPGYLRELGRAAAEQGGGLVSSLFAGTGERTLGGALESAQLNGFDAFGVVTAASLGTPVVVGKSMFFQRSVFHRLGGLPSVANVLAEDYVIGKMFQHGGYRVGLARTVITNVVGPARVSTFFLRHLRWSMLRVRLHPVAFVLEPLASPLAMLPVAWWLLGPRALLWSLGLVLARDVGGWLLLRGGRRWYLPLLLAPLREALSLAIWVATPFVKNVAWRGHPVRVGAGSIAFVRDPEAAAGEEKVLS
ncbi:MAG: glycosyltransferase [Deltaproteobacteria bacterium]|nr:glycosyltransferase [Deltaproteobacteria bacterium]